MSQYPMKCRYGCKEKFSNAVGLRHHYDATHPEYRPPLPRSAAVVVPAVIAHPRPPRLPQGHTAALTADDIVLPAIELMARPGGVVPVAALGALFAWRDATAVMLREVAGDT